MLLRSRWQRLWPWLLLFCLSYALLSPGFLKFPGTDQGVFLYTADRLLRGDILYKDVWDHKGPVFYVLESLGVFLGGTTLFGVVAVQALGLTISWYLSVRLFRQYVAHEVAVLGTIFWTLLYLVFARGGNVPSVYALPCQFFLLYIVSRENISRSRLAWSNGVITALCFFMKPTYVALGIAIFLAGLIRERKIFLAEPTQVLKYILQHLGGFLLVALPIAGYFIYHGAFRTFFDSFVVFNLVHANTDLGAANIPPSPLLAAGFRLFLFVQRTVFYPLTTILTLSWVWLLVQECRGQKTTLRKPLMTVILLYYPLELLASTFTFYRPFYHYYVALLPVASVLLISPIQAVVTKIRASRMLISRKTFLSFGTGILLILSALCGPKAVHVLEGFRSERAVQERIVEEIRERTTRDDRILVWGSQSSLYFFSDRQAASKYSYTSPIFFFENEVSSHMLAAYLEEMKARPPTLIIDGLKGSVYTLKESERSQILASGASPLSEESTELRAWYDFVSTYYIEVETNGGHRFFVRQSL